MSVKKLAWICRVWDFCDDDAYVTMFHRESKTAEPLRARLFVNFSFDFRLSSPCRPFHPVALEEFFPFQESP